MARVRIGDRGSGAKRKNRMVGKRTRNSIDGIARKLMNPIHKFYGARLSRKKVNPKKRKGPFGKPGKPQKVKRRKQYEGARFIRRKSRGELKKK